ncbi:MAG TPA: hypothetical protein VFE47_10575 [Tepidisphaeraceae bacterium]|jgi:hypothetical protein|nr:hypothetical protein [Tepidisphaeraceae bacterium]
MKDEIDYESMSVFEQIEAGLIQALADGCGELTLKTTILPLPPPSAGNSEETLTRDFTTNKQ